MSESERDALFSRVLWIGGAQWAGKSLVAQLLAARYGLIVYAYDYHDARGHADRARRQPARFPHHSQLLAELAENPDAVWVERTPEQMAAEALLSFAERFAMVLEDLAALPECATVLAEGWGLRPSLLAPLLPASDRAVFLLPTEPFRRRQIAALPRAARVVAAVSDPERAQQNRLARDRLLARDVEESAARLSLRTIQIDGAQSAGAIARLIERQFQPYLPHWLY